MSCQNDLHLGPDLHDLHQLGYDLYSGPKVKKKKKEFLGVSVKTPQNINLHERTNLTLCTES